MTDQSPTRSLDRLPGPAFRIDYNGTVVDLNSGAKSLCLAHGKVFRGEPLSKILPFKSSRSRRFLAALIEEVTDGGGAAIRAREFIFEFHGSTTTYQAEVRTDQTGQGDPVVVVLFTPRDTNAVTDRPDALVRRAVNEANDIVAVVERDDEFSDKLRIVYLNHAFDRITGRMGGDLMGSAPASLLGPAPAARETAAFHALFSDDTAEPREFIFRHADGSPRQVEISVKPALIEEGVTRVWISIQRDVTAQRSTAAELAAEQKRLSVSLRSIADGVAVTDADGRIVLLNPEAERMCGWRQDRAAAQPVEDVLSFVSDPHGAPIQHPVQRVLASGLPVAVSSGAALEDRAGERRAASFTASPVLDERTDTLLGVVVVFHDTSEKQRIEEEMQKMQKLESLALLAAGVAHDFNNILTSVLGSISLATACAGDAEKTSTVLTSAEGAIHQAKQLTRQLLGFAKGSDPAKRVASIGPLLEECSTFILRGSNCRCTVSLDKKLPPCDIDEGQIAQVFNNLIVNASQAMSDGGTVRVESRVENLTNQDAILLPPGRYVRIDVTDEGHGISPEILPRIFDPYFTTKGSGSGLGLATCYKIIERHGGRISVDSVLQRGTTFSVFLPALDRDALPERDEMEAPPAASSEIVTGTGRILVMDDEELIKEITEDLLLHLGYEPDFADDGDEAVALYKLAMHQKKPYAAVVLDLTIPGGKGAAETIAMLKEVDPKVKALISTGYTNHETSRDYRKHGFIGTVAKPYTLQQLGASLRAAIEA